VARLVFKDYAQPGDQMTLSFNTAAKKISSVNVNTYMDNPKDAVTLAVQMASLPMAPIMPANRARRDRQEAPGYDDKFQLPAEGRAITSIRRPIALRRSAMFIVGREQFFQAP